MILLPYRAQRDVFRSFILPAFIGAGTGSLRNSAARHSTIPDRLSSPSSRNPYNSVNKEYSKLRAPNQNLKDPAVLRVSCESAGQEGGGGWEGNASSHRRTLCLWDSGQMDDFHSERP